MGVLGTSLAQPNSPPQAMLIWQCSPSAQPFSCACTRQRFGLDTRTSLMLPDPLYTLYLATVVLAGTTGAIVLALAHPIDCRIARCHPAAGRTCRSSCANPRPLALRRFGGACLCGKRHAVWRLHQFAAARPHRWRGCWHRAVMFAGAVGFRLLEQRHRNVPMPVTWKNSSPRPRFAFK